MSSAGTPIASVNPTGPVGPTATAAPVSPPASSLEIDSGLLAVLPREVDGFPVEESPEVENANLADPSVPREVRALAAAFVHDEALANWAVVTVVALHSGVLTDGFHRSWRDTFDAGACEPAGGVTGTATSTIGGRQVDIGRCAGGVNTYHVRLRGDRLVAVTAIGDRRYGELVVAGLTE